jgi:hypothetical protein
MKSLRILKTFNIVALTTLIIVGMSVSGCDPLKVNNPNNLVESDLSNPAAAKPMVNGEEASVTRAINNMLPPYSVASGELINIGSREAWDELEYGNLDDPNNEFSDAAFPYMGEARWWSNDVIQRLETFKKNGTLKSGDEQELARAYLYGGIIYSTIADMFQNFVFSDKSTPGKPIGDNNMVKLYDDAIGYINKGLAINSINDNIKTALLAMRARAYYSKALWQKDHASPVDTVNPLINDANAVADAKAALNLMSGDYYYKLNITPSTPGILGGNGLGGQVNVNLYLRISGTYIVPSNNGKTVNDLSSPSTSISMMDPIDSIPDPVLYNRIKTFTESQQYDDIIVTSKREMLLILAESDLAQSDMNGFTTEINKLRSLNNLTPYSGQIPAMKLLEYERRVNLFLQGRLLNDEYRFDEKSKEWKSNSTAVTKPGTFFPITITERRANPYLSE